MFFAKPGEYEPCGIFTPNHFKLINNKHYDWIYYLDYWLDTCNQGRIGNYEMEGRWSEKTISRHPCFAH